MKRDIEKNLKEWKKAEKRHPIIVRGARQIGKSYIIREFGKREFSSFVELNLEQNQGYRDCFESLEPIKILNAIAILTGQSVIPGKTLLFIDEIQQCPRAILAMRYFYEQMPSLHCIGAGSLLEFTLNAPDFRMPVGRIQYLFMTPLSFGEFIDAVGDGESRKFLNDYDWKRPVPEGVHHKLLGRVKDYMMIGGMPGVVQEYLDSGRMDACMNIQNILTQTYRDDFGKYSTHSKQGHLQKLFTSVPKLTGQKFKYSQVDPDTQSRELKAALLLLEQAGVLYRIRKTSGAGVPLEAMADERNFKVSFLDVGLAQNVCGLSRDILLAKDLLQVNAGALAEQFVAQELIALQDKLQKPSLFYWAREAKNSNAEIDFLVARGASVIPLEVKAGKTGSLKSLHLFNQEYHPPVSIKVSSSMPCVNGALINCPLYAMEQLFRIIDSFLG